MGPNTAAAQAKLDRILARPKRRMSEVRPSEQAGIVCQDPRFWRYLTEVKGMPVDTAEQAKRAVYLLCRIDSRRDLWPGSEAAGRWHELHAAFDVWRRYEAEW